jgi:hypothetical protein
MWYAGTLTATVLVFIINCFTFYLDSDLSEASIIGAVLAPLGKMLLGSILIGYIGQ